MRKIKLYVALFLLGASIPAAGAVIATLRVDPESTLPGLPVAFFFVVTNSSASPVQLSRTVLLDVIPPSGEPFVASWDNGKYSDEGLEPRDMAVPAGGTREFYIPLGPPLLPRPEFFNDTRLNTPGRYSLRARLYVEGNPREFISSTSAVLDIRTPAGDDAAAWEVLRGLSSDGWRVQDWLSPEAALRVLHDYPKSGYAPYATLLGARAVASGVDAYERALTLQVNGPVHDMLVEAEGSTLASLNNEAFAGAQFEKAAEYGRQALKILREIAKSTRYPWVKENALKSIDRVDGPDNLESLFDAVHANALPAPERVVPFVDCVDRTSKTLVARFGFENGNPGRKIIQPGSDNAIAPGRDDQGQPRVFPPGRHSGAFSVMSNGPVTWRLDHHSAVATADIGRCDPDAGLPVRPILECVNHDNQGVVATFGYENPNAFAVVLPVGPSNRFDGEADSGQPEAFLSGRQVAVFKVKVKDSSVTWTLGTSSVTAFPGEPSVCGQ